MYQVSEFFLLTVLFLFGIGLVLKPITVLKIQMYIYQLIYSKIRFRSRNHLPILDQIISRPSKFAKTHKNFIFLMRMGGLMTLAVFGWTVYLFIL